MTDTSAASAGVVPAGIALAATAEPWPAGRLAGLVCASIALGVMVARRYDRLDARVGAPVAGVAGIGVIGAGSYGVLAPALVSGAGTIAGWPALAGIAGTVVVVLSVADFSRISGPQLRTMTRVGVVAGAIGGAGLLGIYAWGAIFAILIEFVGTAGVDVRAGVALSTIAGGLGTATVAVLVLRWTDRDLDYLDLDRPTPRELGIVVVATAAIVGLNLALDAVLRWLGLESSSHALIRVAETDPTILLVLIPLAFLIIGPGEELLYRNVVQKSLYGAYSRPGAVLLASAIFAVVHLPAFADPTADSLATLITLIVVFCLSIVLGVTYERTDNVVVAALVHGGFDAVAFAVTYVQLTGG